MKDLQSVFSLLGLEILKAENGVYHLRKLAGDQPEQEFVGVLTGDNLQAGGQVSLKLFLDELTEDVPAERVIQHWQLLDARRLEESGIPSLSLELDPGYLEVSDPVEFVRPDGRVRHALRLSTGEFVCFN